jgi:hypothetical protein
VSEQRPTGEGSADANWELQQPLLERLTNSPPADDTEVAPPASIFARTPSSRFLCVYPLTYPRLEGEGFRKMST